MQTTVMKAVTAGVAASTLYLTIPAVAADGDHRLIRAQSGKIVPELETQSRLRRRPSWEHKFEGGEVNSIVHVKNLADIITRGPLARQPMKDGTGTDELHSIIMRGGN